MLREAMDLAGSFDRKIVIEAAVPDAREIECAVLGNDEPEASVPGEVVPSREFYDYEAKYLDDGIEGRSSRRTCRGGRPRRSARLSLEAFKADRLRRAWRGSTSCSSGRAARIFVNEVNTIPGFTTISMYPKLWAASGVDYPTLSIACSARSRAPRRQATAAHQHDMSARRASAAHWPSRC